VAPEDAEVAAVMLNVGSNTGVSHAVDLQPHMMPDASPDLLDCPCAHVCVVGTGNCSVVMSASIGIRTSPPRLLTSALLASLSIPGDT
jgi:hypothetical protein